LRDLQVTVKLFYEKNEEKNEQDDFYNLIREKRKNEIEFNSDDES